MSDKTSQPKEEIPAFRVTDKRVDDSWKEEVRREREAAAKAKAGQPKDAEPQPAASPEAPPQSAEAASVSPETSQKKASPAEQQQSKIFMTFLAGLAQQCLMQLGEMENPFSGQQELDLQGARYTVELLATIQNKTKGNLNAEEDRLLTETIRDLKMRYIEVANEVQRQMAAQKAGPGPMRPGPGGTIGGPGRRS